LKPLLTTGRATAFALALLLLAPARPFAAERDDLDAQMKSILDAYAVLERNAADPVSSEQAFYQGAIPGLLQRLDPHSIFFDPGQFEQLRKMESSTQKGFGTVVSLLPGRVIVLQTLPGTPSAKAGLNPGDEILAINGYVVSRLDLEQLTGLLTQSRQSRAELDVLRPGSHRIMRLVLYPEDIQAPSVERAFFIGPGIGYIRVSSFDENTARDLKAAIDKLGGDHLVGLVLDLRNNPGGLVSAALDTAALFLEPGQKIFTVRGRMVPEKSEVVPAGARPYHFKLAILTDGKTASASEIVTGALQDHDRAVVVGAPSFGKGLVQNVFNLHEGTGLALTTALYYTPSGRSIQKPLHEQRPLDSGQFELSAATANANTQTEFRTDSGRKVTGGGGIQPDYVVYPEPMNRLRAALEASGSFPNFATEYLAHHKIDADFEVTGQLLDQFQSFLAARGIQPGIKEWSDEHEFVVNRLKTELFNQAFGVEKGDQVEARRDPVIQKALELVGN
jgi:carboxyl-terminal processing protease